MSCSLPVCPMDDVSSPPTVSFTLSIRTEVKILRRRFFTDSKMIKTLLKSAAEIVSVTEAGQDQSFNENGELCKNTYAENYRVRIVFYYPDTRDFSKQTDPRYAKHIHFVMCVGQCHIYPPKFRY